MRTGNLALAILLFAASHVHAQTEPPNERVVRAEAPIVAGNAVNAKKRALADAFRQMTERALADLVREDGSLPQPLPTGVLQLKASLGSSAQRFIRSYRLIEEGVEGGVLRVMVEADVDTVSLRRALERARGGDKAPPAQAAPRPVANALLVGGDQATAEAMVSALAENRLGSQRDSAVDEAQLLSNAARLNAWSLFLQPSGTKEGLARGTNKLSVRCSLRYRLFQPANAARRPLLDRTGEERGFAVDEEAARKSCFARAAAGAAPVVLSALRTPAVAASFVTVQLEMTDVGSLQALLQALKRMGAVTATEVRRVSSQSAELRVFTRMGGVALGQALAREASGKLGLVPKQSTSDLLVLQVRPADPPADEEKQPRQ